MKRRSFLTHTAPLALMSPVLLSGALKGCRLQNLWQPNQTASQNNGRILVLIQLDGGNDGLNTVIPLDQYRNLLQARKNILIPEKKVLALNNSSVTGLHPALEPLQNMYKNGKLSIIQGVGCTNPDLSHFKAIDIWHTGSDASASVGTGWLGRFLDKDAEQKHKDENADPPAIQIGSALSKALQGSEANAGVAVKSIDYFYDLLPGHYDSGTGADENNPLSFIRTTLVESKDYMLKVKDAANKQKTLSAMYPPAGTNPLADQLKITARLIGGGLQTKIYIVNLKGFDTHDKQVETSDTTQGSHAQLLAQLSTAIAAFDDDLHLMQKQDQVISMVYSEFGRRIKSNDSYGTDHGTSAPVFIFGSKVKGGLVGNNPQIPSNADVSLNLPLQTDFRSVYASLLKNWFGLPQANVNSVLLGNYPMLEKLV